MKNGIAIALVGISSVLSVSAHALLSTSVEPIVGYERAQVLQPTPHTTDRFIYGARVTVGLLMLAAEAEYTRGENTELYTGFSSKQIAQRAKVGLRGQVRLTRVLFAFLRAGGQATLSRYEQTENGVTTATNEPIRYNPYAGVGLRVKLGKNFGLNGDITTVFRDFPNMNNNEYQTSLGFTVSFP